MSCESQIYSPGLERKVIDGSRGYCVVPGLLTQHGLEQFRTALEDVLGAAPEAWLREHSARTAAGTYVTVGSLETPSEFFFRASRAPILLDLAERFGAKAVTPLYVEHYDRPRDLDSGTPPHQDQSFFREFFPDELGITFWIALDDTSVRNGAMHMRPTYDRTLLTHRRSSVFGFGLELEGDQDLTLYEPVCLSAGDALMHSSYTPHYCPPNRSTGSRRAIAMTFRTSSYREAWR